MEHRFENIYHNLTYPMNGINRIIQLITAMIILNLLTRTIIPMTGMRRTRGRNTFTYPTTFLINSKDEAKPEGKATIGSVLKIVSKIVIKASLIIRFTAFGLSFTAAILSLIRNHCTCECYSRYSGYNRR